MFPALILKWLVKVFIHYKIEYFTYALQSEKDLDVVIKGIPNDIEMKVVAVDLQFQGLKPIKVNINTMTRASDHSRIVMVITILPKSDKKTYNISGVLNIKVTVEPLMQQKAKVGSVSAVRDRDVLTAVPNKRMNCWGSHLTRKCKKPKNVSEKCANCGEVCKLMHSTKKQESTSKTTKVSTSSIPEIFTNFQFMYIQVEKLTKLMAAAFQSQNVHPRPQHKLAASPQWGGLILHHNQVFPMRESTTHSPTCVLILLFENYTSTWKNLFFTVKTV